MKIEKKNLLVFLIFSIPLTFHSLYYYKPSLTNKHLNQYFNCICLWSAYFWTQLINCSNIYIKLSNINDSQQCLIDNSSINKTYPSYFVYEDLLHIVGVVSCLLYHFYLRFSSMQCHLKINTLGLKRIGGASRISTMIF